MQIMFVANDGRILEIFDYDDPEVPVNPDDPERIREIKASQSKRRRYLQERLAVAHGKYIHQLKAEDYPELYPRAQYWTTVLAQRADVQELNAKVKVVQ